MFIRLSTNINQKVGINVTNKKEKLMYENSFIQKCLNGKANLFELDNYIEFWHTHDVEVSLRDYLGLTSSEYEEWENGSDSIFRDILRRRKQE